MGACLGNMIWCCLKIRRGSGTASTETEQEEGTEYKRNARGEGAQWGMREGVTKGRLQYLVRPRSVALAAGSCLRAAEFVVLHSPVIAIANQFNVPEIRML